MLEAEKTNSPNFPKWKYPSTRKGKKVQTGKKVKFLDSEELAEKLKKIREDMKDEE